MPATAALTLVPDDAPTAISPARRALADHVEALAGAAEAVERAARPIAQMSDQIAAADRRLAEAETNLAAFDNRHAAAIARAVADGRAAPAANVAAREKLEAATSLATKNAVALRAALSQCEAIRETAMMNLQNQRLGFDAVAVAVIEEEFARALDQREAARAAFLEADVEAQALARLFGVFGRDVTGGVNPKIEWLRAGERAHSVYEKMQRPEPLARDVVAALARWLSALDRMRSDPAARG